MFLYKMWTKQSLLELKLSEIFFSNNVWKYSFGLLKKNLFSPNELYYKNKMRNIKPLFLIFGNKQYSFMIPWWGLSKNIGLKKIK